MSIDEAIAADGVPVTPGMEVCTKLTGLLLKCEVEAIRTQNGRVYFGLSVLPAVGPTENVFAETRFRFSRFAEDCYTTRETLEAAEAAEAAGGKK